MKKSRFEARLKRVVAWDQVPTLSQDEIDDLVELSRTRDAHDHPIEDIDEWESNTHYGTGAMVVTQAQHVFICVEDGVSGALPPVHVRNHVGEYVDGTVKWVFQGRTSYIPTYDLNRAAYEGWGIKAAKASSMISFTADGARYDRDQYIANCAAMQRKYAITGSVKTRGRSTRLYPMILEVRVDD